MLGRLGFPDFSRNKALVVGFAIDALGSGVFIPVSILYFLGTTEVGKSRIGLAMSLAAVAAIPFVVIAGAAVDRFGPKAVVLAANLIQAGAFTCYLLARDFWSIVAVETLASLGQSLFWSAYAPLVAVATPANEREVWFGFLGALRNVGFAVGGLGAGIAVTIGTPAAYHALVVVNAISYLLAFTALLRVPAGHRAGARPQDAGSGPAEAEPRRSWAVVLRDHGYLALVAANAAYAMCTISLNIAMPVYAVDVLDLPGWVGGAMFTLNTVMVGFCQGLVVRRMDGHRRHRVVTLGFAMYAAGFAAFAASGTLSPGAAVVGCLISVSIFTLGELLGGPPMSAASVDGAPEATRGRYLATYQLSWVAASIIAPALLLGLLDHDRFSVWAALIAAAAIGTAILLAAARTLPAARAVITSAPAR